jgi:hypothetical protein
VSYEIETGVWLHEYITSVDRHKKAYADQETLQKPDDRRYHRNYCRHCFPRNEFGESAVFKYFLDWAQDKLNLIDYTGKSLNYYVQVFNHINSKEYIFKKEKISNLIRKLLKSCTFSEQRSLTTDISSVYSFIVRYCNDYSEHLEEEEAEATSSAQAHKIINELTEEDITVNLSQINALETARNQLKEKVREDWDDDSPNNTDNELITKNKGKNVEKSKETALDLQINALNAFLNNQNLNFDDLPEEEIAEIANAFRHIFGENGEYLHSEQRILTVEPFQTEIQKIPFHG